MTQLRSLDISTLDFDEIKTALKTYLQNQTEFTDYDFEGSGLSVLLDVLAYNTHYNAYLANMLSNEMFLDSAVKRASAVSIAKHLGYTPSSTRGSKAILNVTVNSPSGLPATITLDRYTPFSTTIDGTSYTFYNTTTKTASGVGTAYTFSNLEVIEGTLANYAFVVATPGPAEKYEIPDTSVDTTTLRVTVQTSATNTTSETYTLSNDITGVDGTSKIFFLDENPTGRYELYFGDGIIGKKLTAGNIVNVEYLRASTTPANTSNSTTVAFTTTTIAGSSNVTISTASNPIGGRDKETITEIKFNAPRVNAARSRAVTAKDYEALIYANFPEAESVSVWGGEDNVPPIYGKVLISLKPFSGFTITQATKDSIISSILSDKKVLAIQPEFIDPDYYYLSLITNVKYISANTTKTQQEIRNLVETTINNYFDTNLNKFNKNFYLSELSNQIYETDTSIKSVLIEPKLQLRITPNIGVSNSYSGDESVKFYNKIHPGELTSSYFYTTVQNTTTSVYFGDIPDTSPANYDGTGTLKLYNSSTNVVLNTNYGNVNYATGVVNIPQLDITGYPNNLAEIRITCNLQEDSYDVSALRNQILVLDDSSQQASIGVLAGLTINVSTVAE